MRGTRTRVEVCGTAYVQIIVRVWGWGNQDDGTRPRMDVLRLCLWCVCRERGDNAPQRKSLHAALTLQALSDRQVGKPAGSRAVAVYAVQRVDCGVGRRV